MRHAGTISLLSLSTAWERDFLFPSMTFHTANAFDIVCRLDRDDTLDEVPQNNKQKVATGLLFGQATYTRLCWASLQSCLRHRIADLLPHMKSVVC